MIRSRLSILLAEKGVRENRKVTYRVASEETGLSQGVFVRLNGDLGGEDRVQVNTLDVLLPYLGCKSVGDLLEYVPDAGKETA